MLKKALIANSTFSLVSGLALLVLASPLAALIGLPTPAWVLGAVGIGVLLFGAAVGWAATRAPVSRAHVVAVTVCDLSWVLGSAALLALCGHHFTAIGQLLIVAIAAAVAGFMLTQLIGLRRPVVA